MLKIKIISVGKIKQPYFQAAVNDYLKRSSSYFNIEHIVVPTAIYPDKINDSLIQKAKKTEAQSILRRLSDGDFIGALALNSFEFCSEGFSEFIDQLASKSYKQVVFIIGGSYGLDESVIKRANQKISVSKMTLPHELALVFLLEQIYRAGNILNNTPYHK